MAKIEQRGHDQALFSSVEASVATIDKNITDVWPMTMIGLGIVLTFIWSGGLLWLFARVISSIT